MSDRRETNEQRDIFDEIDELAAIEEGFDGWDVFTPTDDDEDAGAGAAFFEQAPPDPQPVPKISPCRAEIGESAARPAMNGRRCPRCGEVRRIEDFAVDRSKASGRKSHCKPCDAAKARCYYEANRERVIARVSERARRLRDGQGRS
jgi:hypothetical protein